MRQTFNGHVYQVTKNSITEYGHIFIDSFLPGRSITFTEQRVVARALKTRRLDKIVGACNLSNKAVFLYVDRRSEHGCGLFVLAPTCTGRDGLLFKADYIGPAVSLGSLILKCLGVIFKTFKNRLTRLLEKIVKKVTRYL